jgi:hypothetical protein
LVVDSLIATVLAGESLFEMSAVDLVKNGIRYPVRLFIKEEPHTLKKVASGKLRLISGVSLIDQIKERLIGSKQNIAEINCWESCSSAPGIGLDDDSLRAVASQMSSWLEGGELSSMDVSSWDWSVKEWMLNADAEARRRLAGSEKGSLFDFLVRAQAYCVSHSMFITPNGNMIVQDVAGKQLSGSYWTSSSNSRMRVIASLVARQMAGVPLGPTCIKAMGDDSVERFYPGVKENLEKLGLVIKDVNICRCLADIEFCSHKWRADGLAEPLSAYKTLYRYFSHPEGSASYLDWYGQLLWVLRNFPSLDKIRDTAFARVVRANNNYIYIQDGS